MFSILKSKAKISHCSLNQSAMDFKANRERILESIRFARKQGCIYRAGAELEVAGYSCDDHFKEIDVYNHCWETVAAIITEKLSQGIVVDLGMPVLHRSIAYNCKVILYNDKVMFIRPKMHLADEGNYRERRFFMGYTPPPDLKLDQYLLPDYIKKLTGQDTCPFGYANIRFQDALVGIEICEEVWRLNSISRSSYLQCDVIFCCNGSHFEKNKLAVRHNLVKEILQKSNGTYIYCNALGFDGSAVYFDGSNLAMKKTGIIQLGEPCSMKEMVCDVLVIDLLESREDRVADINYMDEALRGVKVPDVFIDCKFADCQEPATPILNKFTFDPWQKQVLQASSSYLWDYIRKAKASGVFLPLSGGHDSSLTALIGYYMCLRLYSYCQSGAEDVLASLRTVVGIEGYFPQSPREICSHLLVTTFMGTKESSKEGRSRAKQLAEFIGSEHIELDIDSIVEEFKALVKKIFSIELRFQAHGGSMLEDVALQNITARVRMVMSYLLAQISSLKKKKSSYYLVLAATNLDETLTGYFSKYGCSSADLNLIGTLSKMEIHGLLQYLHELLENPIILEVANSTSSAELRPLETMQTDEDDIGLTFQQIDIFSDTRIHKNSSVISFFKLVEPLFPDLDKETLVEKIGVFYTRYSKNRHKLETLTPTLHLTSKNCSTTRFDLRPVIYEDLFSYELEVLKKLVVNSKQ